MAGGGIGVSWFLMPLLGTAVSPSAAHGGEAWG